MSDDILNALLNLRQQKRADERAAHKEMTLRLTEAILRSPRESTAQSAEAVVSHAWAMARRINERVDALYDKLEADEKT